MLSIQDANKIARQVAREFGVPPPPPLFVTTELPSKYAGAYYHNGVEHIKIRPQYLTEGTIAHEVGHYIFHQRCPGICHGENPECEEIARMIEKWFVKEQRTEKKSLSDALDTSQTALNVHVKDYQGNQTPFARIQAFRRGKVCFLWWCWVVENYYETVTTDYYGNTTLYLDNQDWHLKAWLGNLEGNAIINVPKFKDLTIVLYPR